jgi:3-deoxy-manno-octulosonate cytidylyltransferase (CMP-KDO synthetase)
MKIVGIIPARYASTRLEGKPLIDIVGKPMIQWVYERASEVLDHLYVATDDERIMQSVQAFGGRAIMTSVHHNTGTNRCLEAYETLIGDGGPQADVVINIQGDEPLLQPEQLEILASCFEKDGTEMATLVIPVTEEEDLYNESEVFVTFDYNKNALYFSRSVIPALRGVPREMWFGRHTFYKHLGLYGYTPDALRRFAGLPQSKLEITEGLEQNRWIEHGGKIRIAVTQHQSMPVDTIDDLDRVRKIMGMF